MRQKKNNHINSGRNNFLIHNYRENKALGSQAKEDKSSYFFYYNNNYKTVSLLISKFFYKFKKNSYDFFNL